MPTNHTNTTPREFDNVDDYVAFVRNRTFWDEFADLFAHPNDLPRFRPNPDPSADFAQDSKNIRNYFRTAVGIVEQEIKK